MPGTVPPVADERDGLLQYLEQMRTVLRLTAYGLTDEQARTAAVPSTPLSVGGLIKHVANTERGWIDTMLERTTAPVEEAQEEYANDFVLGPDETLASVLDLYNQVALETTAAVARFDDLSHPVPVPRDVPWFPADVEAWSVRWILLHLIQETARHAGHADIVREAVDGATAYPLMAAAEGWPTTPWIQPWQPADGATTA